MSDGRKTTPIVTMIAQMDMIRDLNKCPRARIKMKWPLAMVIRLAPKMNNQACVDLSCHPGELSDSDDSLGKAERPIDFQ
ncbi:MAG: hypothetical protein ABJM29_16930 [Rhizobiaceae bacterium]